VFRSALLLAPEGWFVADGDSRHVVFSFLPNALREDCHLGTSLTLISLVTRLPDLNYFLVWLDGQLLGTIGPMGDCPARPGLEPCRQCIADAQLRSRRDGPCAITWAWCCRGRLDPLDLGQEERCCLACP
jgi:hypothetical protein